MTRIEFLFSPLALLGLWKREPKDGSHPHPFYGTWEKYAEEWEREKTTRLRDADVNYWKGRALTAEKKLKERERLLKLLMRL